MCVCVCVRALFADMVVFPQVIKFLYQCAEAMGTLGDPVPMAVGSGGESPSSGRHTIQQPATLFSNGHVRAEVAAQVMCCFLSVSFTTECPTAGHSVQQLDIQWHNV